MIEYFDDTNTACFINFIVKQIFKSSIVFTTYKQQPRNYSILFEKPNKVELQTEELYLFVQ